MACLMPSRIASLLGSGLALSLLAAPQSVVGAEPSAIVEEIDAASVEGVSFMDFLYEGMEIELGENESMTLSYFASCRIEEITGGKVKVGRKQSEVSSPVPVVVTAVDCDGGGIVPTEGQGEDVAAIAFRRAPSEEDPPVRVNSTAPLFAFSEPVEALTVERLDQPGEPLTVAVEGTRLDFAKENIALKAGGVYRVTVGEVSRLIKITPKASRHGASLVERLIAF